MSMQLKTIFCGLSAVLCIGLAQAQESADYPNRPIKLILPSAVGGGGDLVGRVIADEMARRLGQSFVVENNAGASGTIAVQQVVRAKPDGYTLGFGTLTSTTIAVTVYPNLPYDPTKDFSTIAAFGGMSLPLVVDKDFPANNLQEFVAYARNRPQPLQYGSWGPGSTGNFCAEAMAQKAGIKLDHIPYKGSAAVLTALMGGEIKVAMSDPATIGPTVRTGRFKAIALCGPRSPAFPDTLPFKEQGVDFQQWGGFVVIAPPGLPASIKSKLSKVIKEIVDDPEAGKKLLALGVTPEFVPGDVRAEDNKKDIEVWRKVAEEAGMKFN